MILAPAQMTSTELLEYRAMSGLEEAEFARQLEVTVDELEKMETGRQCLPARFDVDVIRVVELALNAMPDPGPR